MGREEEIGYFRFCVDTRVEPRGHMRESCRRSSPDRSVRVPTSSRETRRDGDPGGRILRGHAGWPERMVGAMATEEPAAGRVAGECRREPADTRRHRGRPSWKARADRPRRTGSSGHRGPSGSSASPGGPAPLPPPALNGDGPGRGVDDATPVGRIGTTHFGSGADHRRSLGPTSSDKRTITNKPPPPPRTRRPATSARRHRAPQPGRTIFPLYRAAAADDDDDAALRRHRAIGALPRPAPSTAAAAAATPL